MTLAFSHGFELHRLSAQSLNKAGIWNPVGLDSRKIFANAEHFRVFWGLKLHALIAVQNYELLVEILL